MGYRLKRYDSRNNIYNDYDLIPETKHDETSIEKWIEYKTLWNTLLLVN